ncbi:acyl-CoA carboxylase epsilon subunit [Kitasatospora sp. NPDC004531]
MNGPPEIRIVRGSPTAEELAALLAVLAVRTTVRPARPPQHRAPHHRAHWRRLERPAAYRNPVSWH